MTLILSVTTAAGSLQVSDRLVSVGGVKYDTQANKSVVLLARNGLVVASYSGRAYLDAKPTDHWIAERMLGEPLPEHFGMLSRVGGPMRPLELGNALSRVTTGLTTEVSKWNGLEGLISVMVTGFMWKRGRMRPVVVDIDSVPGIPGAYVSHYLPRHSLQPVRHADGKLRHPIAISAAPDGWITRAEIDALNDAVSEARNFEQAEVILVEKIREVSRRSRNRVGEDCMSVWVSVRGIRIRHFPKTEFRLAVSTAGGRLSLAAAVTPWLVSANLTQQPQIIVGGMSGTWAGIPIEIRAPSEGHSGIRLIMKTQPRKLPPK